MSKIIAIFNQKGGVGKTTTVINLASGLALKGKRVLVVDIDPQGNTTSGFGIDKEHLNASLYDALIDEMSPRGIILTTGYENLNILPASIDLAGAEVELSAAEGRESRLKKVLSSVARYYDYMFIDCPPSLGLLSLNALVAAQSVLIPIQCEYYALEGVGQLMSTISMVKQSINPKLVIEGVLMTMTDERTHLTQQVMEEVKAVFKEKVYQSGIPRNIRLAEAPSYGQTIFGYDNRSKGAAAYRALVDEFMERQEA